MAHILNQLRFLFRMMICSLLIATSQAFSAWNHPSKNLRHRVSISKPTYKTSQYSTHTWSQIYSNKINEMNLVDDEPLFSRFQRAVVLQRAGDHANALKEYEIFIKAAQSCNVQPELYAEVHVNMGAIYTRLKNQKEARKHFELALSHRPLGSAHVNLALLILAEGQKSTDPRKGIEALKEARVHCVQAIDVNNDKRSVDGAKKLLMDIDIMLQRAGVKNGDSSDEPFQ